MNKMQHLQFWLKTSSTICLLLTPMQVMAQMTPDTTLPNNSEVNTSNNITTISGGTRVGDNLYHSLSQFSVPTGGTASFDNAADIQNIFTRVTGTNASNIDGLIRANGGANLFLINPNGLIFGEGARLNIGGSFIGSTASRIDFADGNNFSSQPQQTQPLLSVNVPVGLQYETNSGAIQVVGQGNQITPSSGSSRTPTTVDNSSSELSVPPGKTLALVGSNVDVTGGNMTTEGGRIELGSIGNGLVSLQSTDRGWALGYDGVSSYRDVNLSRQALINATGTGSSSIQVRGAKVNISNGSRMLMQNTGTTPDSSLEVNVIESLVLGGTSPDGNVSSGIETQAVKAGGVGANIVVSTPRLVLQDGAIVRAATYTDALGGSVTINAPDSVQLLENTAANPARQGGPNSGISASAYASGNAGSLQISTSRLRVTDGGFVTSSTIGAGAGGEVTINADAIEVTGITPASDGLVNRSNISASSFQVGNAGNLNINTKQLQVRDGATVGSGAFATGSAGNVTINASSLIEVSGTNNNVPSRIRASVEPTVSRTAPDRLGLPQVASGFSGNLTINTPRLNINSGGLVSVRNQGSGNGGTLLLNAEDINVDNSGSINAASASGNGGNITLNSRQLGLRSSEITATAGNNGNGGNIDINTGTLTGTSDSRIVADAQQGTGGNININAQGFFFPIENISASSQLGINGNIQIQTLNENLVNELVELPQQPVDPKNQVVAGCPGTQPNASSSFTITGTGGLPEDPLKPLTEQIVMHDTRLLSQTPNPPTRQKSRKVPALEDIDGSNKQAPQPLVEANSWVLDSKGEVVLLGSAPSEPEFSPPQCHAF